MKWDLVTLDLDGTLLPDDTAFAAILRAAGQGDDVAASDAAFFGGEITLEQCFWQQWDWIKRLDLAAVHRGLRQAPWLPDIREGVRALRNAGSEVCLLTDQPSIITDYLGRWGLIDAICSPVQVQEGRPVDIEARFDKWSNLTTRLRAQGLEPDAVCHVGNGANDVPVWQQVGGSVAVFAQESIAGHADVSLTPSSLMDVVRAIEGM